MTFPPDVLGAIDQLDRKRSRFVVEAVRQEIGDVGVTISCARFEILMLKRRE